MNAKPKRERKTIIVTWTEETVEFCGPEARVDLGERRKTRPTKVAHAVLWKAAGSESDVDRAREYAEEQGPSYRVHVFAASRTDAAVSKWKEQARQKALSEIQQ